MAAETMRTIRSRIKSVENTRKIARAMFLTASAKYRRAQQRMNDSRTFRNDARRILDLLVPYAENSGGEQCCIVITGDRGMSGGYNNRIKNYFAGIQGRYGYVLPIGLKSKAAFGGKAQSLCDKIPSSEKITPEELRQYAQDVVNNIRKGKIGAVDIIYTAFGGEVRKETLVKPGKHRKEETAIFEPDAEVIVDHALADLLAGTIYAYICEANACEQLSRRIAMDAAQNNARDMLEDMRLRLNRRRRANITQEIIEAVAGFGTQTGGG